MSNTGMGLGVVRADRVEHDGSVIVFLDESFAAVTAKTRNISQSGLYVEAKAPVTVGQEIDLIVGGIGSSALRAAARVVRTAENGFGARFVAESPREQAAVAGFVSHLRAAR